ncbi:MAG: hypothetical protein ABSF48_23135 [Thermodesulfobacteriota bacterium]
MEEQAGRVSKRIRSVFLLDASKLGRLLSVVESKFKELGGVTQRFQVTMHSGKNLSVNSVDHVLSQDNAVKNPINELSIAVATPDGSSEALVDFDREDSEIEIRVSSPNVKWGSEMFGEIEEQVDRTLVQSWVYTLRGLRTLRFLILIGLATTVLTFIITTFVHDSGPSPQLAQRLLLSPEDVQRLEKMGRAAQSGEQRVAFLFDFHMAQLSALASRARSASPLAQLSGLGWPAVLVALPFAIILAASWYLFARCYPGSVFAWGDYADHLKALIERRRFLWSAIVIALVIGVVGNLAVYGVFQFARH